MTATADGRVGKPAAFTVGRSLRCERRCSRSSLGYGYALPHRWHRLVYERRSVCWRFMWYDSLPDEKNTCGHSLH
ncbi:hypothetical protein E2C01_016944 [Portunus trituberculatus]|uniref:Uncharacterized protein n=1 Tax=Portunus trituberculatus TaxID=210409 RepID=A0A5B7DR41_PORTR|nr:hypothetical protein [Portunus trituberculatus]